MASWVTFGSLPEALLAIKNLETETCTRFIVKKLSKGFGNTEVDASKRYWMSWIGLRPYICIGNKILACDKGKDIQKKLKERLRKEKDEYDSNPLNPKIKRRPRSSKKLGCPALIMIKEALTFPAQKCKSKDSRKLTLSTGRKVFRVKFPDKDDHKYHHTEPVKKCHNDDSENVFFEMAVDEVYDEAGYQCQGLLSTNANTAQVAGAAGLHRRSMSVVSHEAVIEKMHEFLHTFYACQEHGILSIEAACKKFCQQYRTLTPAEKTTFLCHLAENYGVNQETVVSVARQVLTSQERGEATVLRAEERLRSALVARYHVLFTQIGRVEGGVKFLADMRADVLASIGSGTTDLERAHLQSLQSSLRELLAMWFTVGFLHLERITWQSPCSMVQKISEYEAVHPIRHWADLKRRVGPYRRCFVYLHSSMPQEPVVVLHTALTSEISSTIHSIIGNYGYTSQGGSPTSSSPTDSLATGEDVSEDPSKITTAMFYSITSTQKGLQGVDLGNYLIKTVVSELQQEFPHMSQFSSMSPIPGYRDWLIGEINQELHRTDNSEESSSSEGLLIESDTVALRGLALSEKESALETFKRVVVSNSWASDSTASEVMQAPLMRNCARYLYMEKRRGYALNPVANFHLQNGAVLWRINWMADMSLRGLTKSCGVMVNYRYYLEDTERNSQQYIENQVINTMPQVRQLCQA